MPAMFQETIFTDSGQPTPQPVLRTPLMSRPMSRTSLTSPDQPHHASTHYGRPARRPRWFLARSGCYSVASTRYSEVRRRGRDSMSETTS